MKTSNSKSIVMEFIKALHEALGSKKSLSIAASNFSALELTNPQKRIEGMDWADAIQDIRPSYVEQQFQRCLSRSFPSSFLSEGLLIHNHIFECLE